VISWNGSVKSRVCGPVIPFRRLRPDRDLCLLAHETLPGF
jgi:hypothetical protein